jgi:hypothetical protein
MKQRRAIVNKSHKLVATAPRKPRRAMELFSDARFQPRVVKSKRAYTRRPRNNRNLDQ